MANHMPITDRWARTYAPSSNFNTRDKLPNWCFSAGWLFYGSRFFQLTRESVGLERVGILLPRVEDSFVKYMTKICLLSGLLRDGTERRRLHVHPDNGHGSSDQRWSADDVHRQIQFPDANCEPESTALLNRTASSNSYLNTSTSYTLRV